jgi:hypothetical protein
MPPILTGSLRHFPASEILLLLGAKKHSGTFTAEEADARVRLAFRDGLLVAAEGGGLEPDELIARVASWSDGTFTVIEEVEGATPLSLDITPLVAEAEMRAAESRRLLELFPDEEVRFRVVDKPANEAAISLSADEFQVLFQFATGKTLAELLAESTRPPIELYPIVHKLRTNGLIAEDKSEAETQKSPKIEPDRLPTQPAKKVPIGTLTADDGTMHPLLEEACTIGRTGANNIALGDGSVSSRHARIMRTPEGFVIEDVGSRNGTFVNSEKVSDKRLLADGDTVRLGKVLLTFNLAVETKMSESTQPQVS